jgi:hypothetical protein
MAATTIRNQRILVTSSFDINSQKLVNVATPTSANDGANKAYVDSVSAGLDPKASVRVASQVDVTISAPGAAIDSISMVSGDRVLLKAQSTGSQNGIYIWNGAASPMTRASDADTSAEVTAGMYTFVEEGTNAGQGWNLVTANPITLGTTALVFSQFSGGASITAGAGLALTGSTFDVVSGNTAIVVNANDITFTLASSSGLEISSGLKIAANGVADTMLRQSAGLSIVGRSANSTGDVADITAASDGGVLRRSGTSIGFGTIATTGITDDAVTYAKIQDVSATDRLLGRSSGGSGIIEEITCTAAGRALIDDADASAQRTTLGLTAYSTYTWVSRETPSGTINGSNTVFTLGFTPVSGTEHVYLDGMLMEAGGSDDYTISTTTITFVTAPESGSRLRVSYWK